MSVKYLSSEAKEGGVASLRVSSSFYVAPRDAEPLSASDDDEDVEFLPSLTPITRVLRPQPHQAELDKSCLHSYRSDATMKLCKHDGCTNNVRHRGVCIMHGGKVKSCIHTGCTNGAIKGQVCKKHGAKKYP